MIEYNKIIDRFYPEAGKLRDILYVHSRGVADLALEIFDAHAELFADEREGQRDFVEAAAMLHDIGIKHCNAPGIECYGSEPYICHGTIGAAMLRQMDISDSTLGLDADLRERLARVCERHTGTGLTLQQIQQQNLPLPHIDLVPETMAECLVCYADKFFSKTHPEVRKSFEKAKKSLMKFGEAGVEKFCLWHDMFSSPI